VRNSDGQYQRRKFSLSSTVVVVARVDYLLLRHDEFSILSDHRNLTNVYNPPPADPTLAHHVLHKLQRWALKMSMFLHRMEHAMGEFNYWTDLMTRWGVGYRHLTGKMIVAP
jgi:hypothetical protein